MTRPRKDSAGSRGGLRREIPGPLRLKVAHLTSVHPAYDTRILHRECKTLVTAGYEVVLVVPHHREEILDGVTIRPVPLPTGRRSRILTTARRVYRAALRERADLYHFHDPELIPAAILLKLRGKTVVADVHEDVPADILTKFWLPRAVRRPTAWMADKLEGMAHLYADAVIAATPAIGRRFPSDRTLVVRNFPIANEWESIPATPYAERPPLAAYVGKIEAVRGIREMVTATHLVGDVRLALAGAYEPKELESEMRLLAGWERVESMGFLSRPEVGRLLGRARIGLVLLPPGPNHTDAQPNKLFEYMAAGLPVVASNFPAWKRLIEELDCGLVVDPLEPAEIARAISALLQDATRAEDMGRRGREAVTAQYNWNLEARDFLSLYERLTRQGAC